MRKVMKFMRGIIRCFIPFRAFRHAVQEGFVLEYFRVLFFNLFHRKQSLDFPYKLSVCLIIKNAACYMDEWINYHKIVGVDHFYIYDNESEDNLKEVLAPYIQSGLVEYNYWSGRAVQSMVYNHCLKKHRFDTEWLAFIDDDEFIVPMKHKTIVEVLDVLQPKNALAVSWCLYGSNGLKKYDDRLVIERFTKHMSLDGRRIEVKTIVNPRKTFFFMIHHGFYPFGVAIDENRKRLKKSAHHNFYTGNLIRINHYHVKSLEECLLKEKRGDAACLCVRKYSLEWFNRVDNSNVVEDNIMEKYIPQVKEMICKIRKE